MSSFNRGFSEYGKQNREGQLDFTSRHIDTRSLELTTHYGYWLLSATYPKSTLLLRNDNGVYALMDTSIARPVANEPLESLREMLHPFELSIVNKIEKPTNPQMKMAILM